MIFHAMNKCIYFIFLSVKNCFNVLLLLCIHLILFLF